MGIRAFISTLRSKIRIIATTAGIILLFLLLISYFALLIRTGDLQVLHPQGYISAIQNQVFWGAIFIGLIIAFFIISAFLYVVFRFREGATHETFTPDWTASKRTVLLWWIIPLVAILAISGVLIKTAREVDPYKPITASAQPITIQVVALQWKWLFIYPQQQIATVNFVEFPVDTPINFRLTADAPMNAFWIPSLGGQVYEMSGMVTQLHLLADNTGDFQGSPALISGKGFASMRFIARSATNDNFNAWVQTVNKSADKLDFSSYSSLAQPKGDYPVEEYALTDKNLFNEVLMKYMPPGQKMEGM